ncbi:hypothetical protein WB334_25330 [Escherichia coli]|uniref:hypothetical protein n=1 Tax=Escherichia coli TaxID=562 RepID=UPI0021570BBB|nr:hypothetical protein [Escherichia coli]MCR8526262.1 hypothetical protein [Escherichia coli]
MTLRRKAAVGTAYDREELEDLYRRLGERIQELKDATFELTKATTNAKRVAETLNAAVGKADAASRRFRKS